MTNQYPIAISIGTYIVPILEIFFIFLKIESIVRCVYKKIILQKNFESMSKCLNHHPINTPYTNSG